MVEFWFGLVFEFFEEFVGFLGLKFDLKVKFEILGMCIVFKENMVFVMWSKNCDYTSIENCDNLTCRSTAS